MASGQPSGPPPGSPSRSSRNSSISGTGQPSYRPTVPSGLRQAEMAPSSPEDRHIYIDGHSPPDFDEDGIHPATHNYAEAAVETDLEATHVQGAIEEPHEQPDARTKLLGNGYKYHVPDCGHRDCDHGTYSPRPRYWRGYGSFATNDSISSRQGFGGPSREGQLDGNEYRGDFIERTLGPAVSDGLLGRQNDKNTTSWLARKHGVKHPRLMYAHISLQHPTHFTLHVISIRIGLFS